MRSHREGRASKNAGKVARSCQRFFPGDPASVPRARAELGKGHTFERMTKGPWEGRRPQGGRGPRGVKNPA